jgi:hypothetical protein
VLLAESADGPTVSHVARAGRRTVVTIVVFVLFAAGTALVLGSTGTGPSLRAALRACAGSEECVREALRSRSGEDPVKTVAGIEEVYRSEVGLVPDCHRTLHIYGQERSREVLEGRLLGLEDLWRSCGAGVLHGVYESLRVPADVQTAAAVAYPLCREADFANDPDLLRGCYHSLGHSFFDSSSSIDRSSRIKRAEEACGRGRSEGFDDRAVASCLNGAYMRDRDARLAEDGPVVVKGTWEETLPQCQEAADRLVCAILYYEPLLLATEDPETVALDFHRWCVSLDARAPIRCSEFLGSTLDILAKPGGEDPAVRCLGTDGVEPLPCLFGLRSNMAARGRTREEIDARICPLAVVAELICEATLTVP